MRKLSEILISAEGRVVQGFRSYYGGVETVGDDLLPKACAVGAISLACGWNPEKDVNEGIDLIKKETGIDLLEMLLDEDKAPRKAYVNGVVSLETALIRLNDDYRWTFSEISSWLKGLGL